MSERRSRFDLSRQLRQLTPLVLMWSLGFSVIAAAALQNRIPLTSLFLDPTALSDLPWYVGLLSNVGVLAWTVAAASALGGAWVAGQTDRPSASRFLGWGGVAAAMLLLDDLFLLHSSALPKLLGVGKPIALLAVVTPTLVWLVRFTNEILRTRWMILAAALGAFATSVGADQLLQPGTSTLLIEDGSKLLGVLAWSLYFVLTTHDIARSTIRTAMAKDPLADFVFAERDEERQETSLRDALSAEARTRH